MLEITPSCRIVDSELQFEASRSSGPGGQNVNKLNTRMTLVFDLEGSPSLTQAQKRRLRRRLANRLTKEGLLRLSSQKHRTQLGNRKEVEQRFVKLLSQALRPRRRRIKTHVPKSARRRRRQDKEFRSRIKKLRGSVSPE